MTHSSQAFSNRPTARAVRFCLITAAAVASGAMSFAASAVPVIPGESSSGINTPAGRGGAVIRVTNLNPDGAGSLKACVDATGPRTCVFEVSGTIPLKGDLVLLNPNITIAGQTAPSPGIMLRNAGLLVRTSDVLVQHIHVRPGDDPGGEPPINRDGLKVSGPPGTPNKNVVIDHCSFSWSIDELASAWASWDNVSIINSIFAEPLNQSIHPEGAHGYGVIFGPVPGNITFANNLISGAKSRNPLSNSTKTTIVNNVIYNWTNKGTELQSHGAVTTNSIVGNVYVKGPLTTSSEAPILVRADSTKPPAGSKVFVADNAADGATADPWAIVATSFGSMNLASYKSANPVVWPAGFTTMPTADNVVLNHVLKFSGARPADRDPIDTRVIDNVRNRTGSTINCVSPNGTERCNANAGGWPTMAQNSQPLTLPADPNTVTESGYTNLELWLQDLAADVEGRARRAPAAPVLAGN